MSSQYDAWLAPPQIKTPSIHADVVKYVAPDLDETGFNALPKEVREKLALLAERLEFVDHLKHASGLICRTQTRTCTTSAMPDGRKLVYVAFSNVIEGHEFAGFNHDIDSLCVYFLVSCIDSIMTQPKYVPAITWMDSQPKPWDLAALQEKYNDEYGLARNFRAAFTHHCSEAMKTMLIDNLAIARLADNGVVTADASSFEDLDREAKLKSLANKLYEMRSGFTHSSLRAFSPRVRVDALPAQSGTVLVLRPDGVSLFDLLTKFIVDLARVQLLRQGATV